ncbi:MAG: SDR family oxidoreductase [Candidatus Rokubacteria bacterium]|nr:SDR family oxidoreductase [Candidatus Rokubacteria bacterium]
MAGRAAGALSAHQRRLRSAGRGAPRQAEAASVRRLMDLIGRRALVTGAAGHVGLIACETLMELGASVAVLDRDAAACRARAEALLWRRQGRAVPLPCDLRDEAATRAAARQAVAGLGGLDILIHAAAFVGTTQADGWAVPFEQQTVEAWDAALRVNLTSAFVMVQEARQALAASGHGSIILFGSIYGTSAPDARLYAGTAMAHPAGYGASKGGLLALTRNLATTLAPRVRVNMISPGGILRDQPEAFVRRYEERTPLGRMATEEDLRGAVAYLASDLSAYVTGQNLVVDGGWTIW